MPQLGVAGRLRGLGRHLLGEAIRRGGDVAFRRIVPQEIAHGLHAPQQFALRIEEAGHFALAAEIALHRGAEDEIAPLVLAHLVIGGADLHDLGEWHLLVGPPLLDDLEVVDDLRRRPDFQVDVRASVWTASL